MTEWPKVADCKSVVREFESHSVLQLHGLAGAAFLIGSSDFLVLALGDVRRFNSF